MEKYQNTDRRLKHSLREETMAIKTDGETFCYTSAVHLAQMIRQKKISPVEVINSFIRRIEAINPQVNAFCTLTLDSAIKEAQQAEKDVMAGHLLGPLHGVPFSVKDLLYTKGVRTMRGSKIFESFIPLENAPMVERLKKAGAILMGKTTTPEFGHKGVTDSPLTGITRNPWDLDLTPGGSSGGAAAQVASGMTPLAVGTDGGGSIRNPASLTGIYGMKPTYGRVPLYPAGVFDALSHAGPMTRTVADGALMLSVMAGQDESDPLSLEGTPADYQGKLHEGIKGLRIAWSPNLGYVPVVEKQVAAITAKAVKVFEELGGHVEEVTDTGFEDPITIHVPLWFGGLAGFLGDYLPEWEAQMDPLLVSWTKLGLQLTAADFVRAQIRRNELRDKVRRFFQNYDLLLTPTLPIVAFKAGVSAQEGLKNSPVDHRNWSPFSAIFNLTQVPAASIPAGFTQEGLPVGLQIVGPRFADLRVLQASAAFESIRPWGDQHP
jgi:aspartyl-tRNA(Asn)/glutamyl-tRNA(Gln) amidotransferase subunit A